MLDSQIIFMIFLSLIDILNFGGKKIVFWHMSSQTNKQKITKFLFSFSLRMRVQKHI